MNYYNPELKKSISYNINDIESELFNLSNEKTQILFLSKKLSELENIKQKLIDEIEINTSLTYSHKDNIELRNLYTFNEYLDINLKCNADKFQNIDNIIEKVTYYYNYFNHKIEFGLQQSELDKKEIPLYDKANGIITLPKDTLKKFVYAYIKLHSEYTGQHKELTEKLSPMINDSKPETIIRYSKNYSDKTSHYKESEIQIFIDFISKHNL